MNNSDSNTPKAASDSLEVELPELPEANPKALRPGQEKASEVRQRESEWAQTVRAMRETKPLQPSIAGLAWKSFMGVGLVSASYFLSLAYSEPAIFREGAGILWWAAQRILLTIAVWGLGFWCYQQSSPANQAKIEKGFFLTCVLLALLVAFTVMGFKYAAVRRLWASPIFLLSLGLQAVGIFYLWRFRKQLLDRIEFGSESRITRPLLYLSEGVLLYLSLGIFLQAVLRIHVPALVGMAIQSPQLATLFFCPLAGYFILRKLFGEL